MWLGNNSKLRAFCLFWKQLECKATVSEIALKIGLTNASESSLFEFSFLLDDLVYQFELLSYL